VAKKILLADDSLTIQKVVELTFSDSEYDLLCVPNGQRALEKVVEEAPDLILADVVMPEKNGYEVCEAIKGNPATARIPVILLSGTFEPFDRDRAERLGCDAIVSKPFDSQQLLRQVEALLARAPEEVPSSATVAIPINPNPQPPATATTAVIPERAKPESSFAEGDFTASIRVPRHVDGGPDLFEEEYGQADVESAIAAFEKAHPEFSHAEESPTSAAMDSGESNAVEPPAGHHETAEGGALAGWLRQDAEASGSGMDSYSDPEPAEPAPVPAPYWVPRHSESESESESEPELQPIPFAADDSASRHSTVPPAATRADEAPTQQIPLSADYASLARESVAPVMNADPERVTDRTRRETPVVPPPAAPEAASSEPAAAGSVSREIELLAETTSIRQLKEMLSSVSVAASANRPEGGLSDDEIDRLASRVVERLSEKIVREIAWEVIPDVAELVIKQRIKELESGVE
jgi:CheY-like chemotaxis protein